MMPYIRTMDGNTCFPLLDDALYVYALWMETLVSHCQLDDALYGYLDTWSGFEAAKTASWPSRGLHHCGKFLEPSDE